jgi:hypothetical protein
MVERPLNRFRIVALAVVLLVCSMAMYAAESPTVELTIDDLVVSMDDVVHLDIRIVNSTTDVLWIFGDLRWGPRGGLVLNVSPWGPDGPLPLVVDHAEFTKDELSDTRSLVRLRPGAFVGRKREMKVSDLVRKPGEYRIWVEYQAPLPAAAFEQSFWSAEKPSLTSRALTLIVTRTAKPKE